jgi:serine/threonine-protein kinase
MTIDPGGDDRTTAGELFDQPPPVEHHAPPQHATPTQYVPQMPPPQMPPPQMPPPQMPPPSPPPPPYGYVQQGPPSGYFAVPVPVEQPRSNRTGIIIALGVAVLFLAVGVFALVLTTLDKDQDVVTETTPGAGGPRWPPTTIAPTVPSTLPAHGPPIDSVPPVTSSPQTPAPVASSGSQMEGDLGIRGQSISRPSCDGSYATFVFAAVTPNRYASDVAENLSRYPGSSYLRTDLACSSLRPYDGNGNRIYSVYYGPFRSVSEACSARPTTGSYVRILANTGTPAKDEPC